MVDRDQFRGKRGPFLPHLVLLGPAVLITLGTCLPADDDFFEKSVRPLLVNRCYACHAGEKAGGGLSLETRAGWKRGGESGPAIVAGHPEESLLIEAIRYQSLEMPPPDAGGKLSDDEISILTRWVELGAPDPRDGTERLGGMTREAAAAWWAFQPLPEVTASPTPDEIDALLDREIVARQLTRTQLADKRTLLRRVTYDLTGLPPTADEMAAFLADDSPEAFAHVVDRLLAMPQYGEHWGRHWLDVVRYADTAGENTDRPLPHAWRYRNWVIDSLNADLSYDQFVRLQLCGDLITGGQSAEEHAAGIVATGYLAIARRFGHDIDKDMHLTCEDVIDNLGKNFLGLSLGCARCHDHKYDPVTSDDYYALYGVFGSTRFAFPGCEARGQPRDLVPLIPTTEVDALTAEYQSRLSAFEQREKAAGEAAGRLKSLADGAMQVLSEGAVGEGATVAISLDDAGCGPSVSLRGGEVLQLRVQPNGNHGADTTRIEWRIASLDDPDRTWDVSDLIPRFADEGPALTDKDATWCVLDVADGPKFLSEHRLQVNDQPALTAWSLGDTPSALVNASPDPIPVWTTLPGNAFFIHPGPERDVAVAWVCPADGEYQVTGAVTDAHPAGLDGVSFQLEYIASAEYGTGLSELGRSVTNPGPPKPEPPTYPVAYAVADATPQNVHMHLRGDPEQLGDEIPRHWLSAFGGTPLAAAAGSGRRELAGQIVSHPLFARVMVNRIWQWHFGRGLVASPNDFGSRGEPPSHPELLDWLAAHFRANGYRLKPLHRLILLTDACQRSSAASREAIDADPENRWLARFSRRRLSAEELRDSLLAASSGLDRSPGETHPFPPEASWTFTQHNPFTAVYDTSRRSVYLMVQRQRRHPYLALFDGADPNSSTPARQSTTVPTQALYFLNDPFFHAQAAGCFERVRHLPDVDARLRTTYQRLFQLPTDESELAAARDFLTHYPGSDAEKWSALLRVLLTSNEFLYLD